MAKFKPLDIVIGNVDIGCMNYPIVILGEHTFPDGTLAYRCRAALPGYDDLDGREHWDKKDGYHFQSYLDQFELLWRRK